MIAATLGGATCSEPSTGDDARDFVVTVSNLTPAESVFASGRFDTPDTLMSVAPLEPDQSYRFEVVVEPGAQLQVISTFLESNDAFLAFAPGGIALWDYDGEPLEGDRTDELVLYDAGTEVSEPLGIGDSQPLRQPQANYGPREKAGVRIIADYEDGAVTDEGGIEYPSIADFAELTILHLDGSRFEVQLRNVSAPNLLGKIGEGKGQVEKPALLSRGVFSVHEPGVEWFDVGARASEPLERLAEDGEPTPLATEMAEDLGVSSAFSGVVWAIHDGQTPLCEPGSPASVGLESLVEDGRAQDLLTEIGELETVTQYGLADRTNPDSSAYAYTTSVFGVHESVELRFTAGPGDHLTLITGYLAANDKFVGTCAAGVPLFSSSGVARDGSLAAALTLYDAGTEIDEPPGLGAHQFERQTSTNSGIDEHGEIQEVDGWWMHSYYPSPAELLDVSIHASSSTPARPDDGIP